MKTTAALAVVCICAALVFSCASASDDPNMTGKDSYAGYASWTKVNAETISVDSTGVLGRAHEGSAGFREVYVNAAGKPVSDGSAALPYPFGSIIVKESFKSSGGSKGDMSAITIMVKREDGYDSDNGDWEYVMLNAAMKIQGQGKLGACISCHAAADNDWVFTDNR